jgi:hypothetical protein
MENKSIILLDCEDFELCSMLEDSQERLAYLAMQALDQEQLLEFSDIFCFAKVVKIFPRINLKRSDSKKLINSVFFSKEKFLKNMFNSKISNHFADLYMYAFCKKQKDDWFWWITKLPKVKELFNTDLYNYRKKQT